MSTGQVQSVRALINKGVKLIIRLKSIDYVSL